MAKSKSKKANNPWKLYVTLIAAVTFLVIGGLALWAHTFIGNMVRTELAAQKIYFPEKGAPELDPAAYPDLQKYAGNLVDTPEEAKAYANGYIGRHLAKVANGKVYAEVSAEAQKDPTNELLQKQRTSLFQGETLRGILLTSGYGFGTIGKIAGTVAYLMFIIGGVTLLAAVLIGFRRQ